MGDVVRGGDKRRGGLEEDDGRFQRLGHGQGSPPGLPDLRRGQERTISVPASLRDGFGELPVGGACGRVRDQLPGLQGEFEVRRRRLAPPLSRFQAGRLIERGVDFDHLKNGHVAALSNGKTAAASFNDGAQVIDDLSVPEAVGFELIPHVTKFGNVPEDMI